jgi:hypothetical protein
MPETISSLVALIKQAPAPVVLLDTCALLDIVRASHREELSGEGVEAALSLAERARQHPRGAWLVVAEVVDREWTDNWEHVVEEARRAIGQLERRMDKLRSVAKHVVPLETIAALDLNRLQIHEHLKTAAHALLKLANIIELDPDAIMRARTRLTTGTPPAAKGKQEFKDCEIFEHYLALGRALQADGFQQDLFFVSSNTRDYGTPGKLLPELEADLRSARMQLITSFAWLNAVLNRH